MSDGGLIRTFADDRVSFRVLPGIDGVSSILLTFVSFKQTDRNQEHRTTSSELIYKRFIIQNIYIVLSIISLIPFLPPPPNLLQ